MSSSCNPIVQQARQNALDAAYFADGRDNPKHPHHSTYTALMSAFVPATPSLEDLLAEWWRSSYPNSTLNAQTGAMMCAFAAWILEQQERAADS